MAISGTDLIDLQHLGSHHLLAESGLLRLALAGSSCSTIKLLMALACTCKLWWALGGYRWLSSLAILDYLWLPLTGSH